MKYEQTYMLLRDFPWAEAGTIYEEEADGYWYPADKGLADYKKIPHSYIHDTDWFKPIEERYKPEEEDSYWFVTSWGFVKEVCCQPEEGAYHEARYEMGNCFRTEEQTKEALKRIEQVFLDFHKELQKK